MRLSSDDHITARSPISLFGAALDTGNLGVSALGLATLAGISQRAPQTPLTLFDNGEGVRQRTIDLGGRDVPVEFRGAWMSRRLHRPESLLAMNASSVLGPQLNPNIRAIDRSAAVLDITGGDSFCDLYGEKRFRMVALPKRIALRRSRPLILLPQTYGPFRRLSARTTARRIIVGATSAWARDEDSFESLKELLGRAFDPERHHLGVDVAFLLPSVEPAHDLGIAAEWLAAADPPVVGVNVSGLLYNHPEEAGRRFGLETQYREATQRLVRELVDRHGQRVLLVPHVLGTSEESDTSACEHLASVLDRPESVAAIPGRLQASEAKWVISHLEWFTGARMHATIAALSSGTPVAGVAYSDKIRGVFGTCGVADEVVDARTESSHDLVERLLSSFERRGQTRQRLAAALPATIATASRQFDQILSAIPL